MPPAAAPTTLLLLQHDAPPQQQQQQAIMETDTLLLGAGPQALCLASALLEPQPYALDDHAALAARRRRPGLVQGAGPACRPEELLVVDPAASGGGGGGGWLAGWRAAFAYFEIPVLRSHMLAHPDPRTELALLLEAEEEERENNNRGGGGGGGSGSSGSTGIDVLSWNKRLMKGGHGGGGGGEDTGNNKKQRKANKGGGKTKGGRRASPASSIRPFLQDHAFLFARPSSAAFLRLCDGLVERYGLADRLLQGKAVSMTRTGPNHVLVGLSDGRAIRARRVVCCLGPSGQLRIPPWALPFRPRPRSHRRLSLHRAAANPMGDDDDGEGEEQEKGGVKSVEGVILHSHELPGLGVPHAEMYAGRRVLVVGGGLTAAHLVLSAHRHGAAAVTLLARRPIRLQEFCFGVEWAGREQHGLLARYRALPLPDRLRLLQDSRPGGTVTPAIMTQLRALEEASGGKVRIVEGAEVASLVAAAVDGGKKGWTATLTNGGELGVDRVLLATGVEVDVRRDPLLAPFVDGMAVTTTTATAAATSSSTTINTTTTTAAAHCFAGLPVPNLSLRLPLAPGMEVYTMGPYAALAIGPNAGNLAGGMAASRIIADEIRASKDNDKHRNRVPVGSGGRGDEEEDDEEDEEWARDIHDLNNPFDLLGDDDEEDEEEEEN